MADMRSKERTLEIEELKLKKASAETELAELAEMWDGQAIGPSPLEETERRPEEIKKKIRQLERTLKEMGNVQMGVLSEDESLQRRLEYLGEQLRDVSSGIEELERLISKADEHASRIFKDALRNINSRFSELFKNLFGGGEAQLRMAEGGDLWESGVEVIACPPGKRPQHIGQLSGGEQSLAAISLLFAAMEVAEVPIAVLDEVDAALDESNLRRFAALAEEYGKRIQLLCMTHRRATMEHADIMYGVTLSEPGLSQIVGVRLEDWD
jgi:chromosome segregation protein